MKGDTPAQRAWARRYEADQAAAKTMLRCKNCGEHISQYGPETFHIESTLIVCDPAVSEGTRAEVADDVQI
jgi:hypothetical protein